MRTRMRSALCVWLLAGLSNAVFGAADNNFIAPEARGIDGGRDVHLIVAQPELQPMISVVSGTSGVGMLNFIIEYTIDSERSKKAESIIDHIRSRLDGYDFDARAQKASDATLAGLGWFNPRPATVGRDESRDGLLAVMDKATAPQLMLLRYDYGIVEDFSQIIVMLDASLVDRMREARKPLDRLKEKNLAYVQRVRSVVKLPTEGNKQLNAQAWADNGGRLARAALDLGIERCQTLLLRSLNQTPEKAAALLEHKKRKIWQTNGIRGWRAWSNGVSTIFYEPETDTFTQLDTVQDPGTPQPASTLEETDQ